MTTDIEKEILTELKETRKDVIEIKIVLKGYNGNPGLCKDVDGLKKFRRNALFVFAFLAGSGGIGFGIIELVKVLG